MAKAKHPLGGREWGQYTVVVEKELLGEFRQAVKEQGEAASTVVARFMRAYLKRVRSPKALKQQKLKLD